MDRTDELQTAHAYIRMIVGMIVSRTAWYDSLTDRESEVLGHAMVLVGEALESQSKAA